MREKFAAKFAEAGNLKLQDVSQFPTFVTTRSGLDIDRFPQYFSALQNTEITPCYFRCSAQ